MRTVNLTKGRKGPVIDGLHAGQANGFPLLGKLPDQEYCKEPHKSAEKISFKHVYVGLAIAQAAFSC
ncbi:hypothetical protein [Pseudomonas sp. S2_A02]